jgi:LuxR family maltose regulon positive regulatory protein
LAWASEHGLSVDDDLSYIHEYEHIALAEVMLARYTTQPTGSTLQATHGLLERLLVEAQRGARTGNVIEILALQALAHDASGSTGQALPPLQRALTLAEPQGYVRVFTRHGTPMASMLSRLVPGMPDRAYLRRLIAATAEHLASLNAAESARSSTTQRLVDPLSPRELEVLRLLSTELDGPELARHLVVSLNTLRTHTKNIYAKLDVTNRRAAVRRAAELDLLERHLDR